MFTVQNVVMCCCCFDAFTAFFGKNINRKQGTPTIQRTAGVGVSLLIWIIVSISGICPSQAPA